MSHELKTTKKYSKYNIKFKSYNIIYKIKIPITLPYSDSVNINNPQMSKEKNTFLS